MPIWQQLADQITESIVTGEYPPGERFPAVRELALQADVNPNTMQRALAKLEEQGLLVTARTAGRTVTEDQQVLQETRKRLAERKTEDYMEGMKKLGYSREEAAAWAADFGKEGET
jgi:DNA-binding transcriptional regulator YhcF (GntR family)